MRRPQSAFGLAAVTASLLVATIVPAPVQAARVPAHAPTAHAYDAAARCTQWTSDRVPPPTIRVLRSKRPDVPDSVAGTVQEVDFREYVATVMSVEWPEHYPLETLKAGAVATKQFAWYYIIHPRGRTVTLEDGGEACYDVVDTTVDQYYYPEHHAAGPKIEKALDATWNVTVRKYSARTASSRLFLTGYRDGRKVPCGADRTGFKLFHRSTTDCGKKGWKYREILRKYLSPRLEIVTSGRHDIVGTQNGDAAAMVRDGSGHLVANVWTPGSAPPEPGTFAGLKLTAANLLAYRSADVDGDHRDDLVWLEKTGAHSGRLKVALSNGVDYGPAETWFAGDMGAPLKDARLLIGDFNANGRRDAAILADGSSTGKARLIIFRNRKSGGFGSPVQWWSGTLSMGDVAGAWVGDVSGDGRADLIVRQDLPGGGLRIRVAVGKRPSPGMGGLIKRFQSTHLKASKTRIVQGDANRDGREDLLLIIGSRRTRIIRLQGKGLGGLKWVKIWRAPRSNNIPVGKSRFAATDIDLDGRTDLVVYTRTDTGTQIRVLKTRYKTMKRGPKVNEGIDFADIRPY